MGQFSEEAPSADPVFYRTYSRLIGGKLENWEQVTERTTRALACLGKFSAMEASLVRNHQLSQVTMASGRWLWVGGTAWADRPESVSGGYNCTSSEVNELGVFRSLMNLSMMGCGTGAVLERRCTDLLPPVKNNVTVEVVGTIGAVAPGFRKEDTVAVAAGKTIAVTVGDSREGWADAYQLLIASAFCGSQTHVIFDLSGVRPQGEKLQGFGGTANPRKLPELFPKVAAILNGAVGRNLTPLECCKIIDEAALVVVAGSIRRSAGIRQFDAGDDEANSSKDGLWQQAANGDWVIDPAKDCLRMANHTRVFHQVPSLAEITESVSRQFYSGEGAIQYAPEAIARANADILVGGYRTSFLEDYEKGGREAGREWLKSFSPGMPLDEIEHRLSRYGLNPCAEILGADFHCNLSEVHLNQLAPDDTSAQDEAFRAAALSVAALLNQRFPEDRHQRSREMDPIVGVSFTGLFDFFVEAMGVPWLEWWQEGRPKTRSGMAFREEERAFLNGWRQTVETTLAYYCGLLEIKMPNRYTTVQPAGTKSLLTGASPGWHPPKAPRFIRRITFRREDPVAMACLDFGYSAIPSQSDKDDDGRLLNDPWDPRCTEWLIEIPTKVKWADMLGAESIDISQFSAVAQFDFFMQVQRHYTTHNTSATIELRADEVPSLAGAIHDAIVNRSGYVSAALLARFDDLQYFPRLPFEPIDEPTYQRLMAGVAGRRTVQSFEEAIALRQVKDSDQTGPAQCDSVGCLQ